MRKSIIGIARYGSGSSARIALFVAITVGSSYLVAKVVAVLDGPSGVGFLGAIMGAVSLLITFSALGLPSAIPVLQRGSLNQPESMRTLRRTSVLFLASIPILLLISMFLVKQLDKEGAVFVQQTFSLFVAGMAAIGTLLVSAVEARYRSPVQAALTSMLSALSSAVVTAVFLLCFHNIDLLSAIAIGSLVSLLVLSVRILQLRSVIHGLPNGVSGQEAPSYQRIIRFAIPMWLSSLGSNFAWSIFPIFALTLLGSTSAGYLKADLSLSMLLFYLGDAWRTYKTYPELARHFHDSKGFSQVLKSARKQISFGLVPLGVLLQVAAPLLLWILYSSEFIGMALGVGILSLAAIFRVALYTNLSIFAVHHRVRIQVFCEWAFAVALLGALVVVWLTQSGIYTYMSALLVASLITFLITELIAKAYRLPSVIFTNREMRASTNG